jgi:hypothetical protein
MAHLPNHVKKYNLRISGTDLKGACSFNRNVPKFFGPQFLANFVRLFSLPFGFAPAEAGGKAPLTNGLQEVKEATGHEGRMFLLDTSDLADTPRRTGSRHVAAVIAVASFVFVAP